MSELNDEKIPFEAMLNNSNMMYIFQSLRQVVLDHSETFGDDGSNHEKVKFIKPQLIITQLDERCEKTRPNAYLTNSVTAKELLEFLQLNRNYYDDVDLSFNENWREKTAAETKPMEFEDELEIMANQYDLEFWEYDDEFQSHELVYGVLVNRAEKRIVIGFRGSVTVKDFIVDLTSTSRVPEELDFAHDMGYVAPGDVIKIHRGFNDYLFGHGEKKDSKLSKFEDVLRDLEDVYKYKDDKYDYSEFKLYLTGHSLGGALASLLAVALAGHDFAKKYPAILPVTAITYASPRAGGRVFKEVHERLERDKKLRHIRISNQGDIIPVAPFLWSQTGLNIHVCNGAPAKIGYNVEYWSWTQIRLVSLARHSLESYLDHLNVNVATSREQKSFFASIVSFFANLHVKAPYTKVQTSQGPKLNQSTVLDKSIKQLYSEYAGFEV